MMKAEEEEQNWRHHCTIEPFLLFFSQIIRFFSSTVFNEEPHCEPVSRTKHFSFARRRRVTEDDIDDRTIFEL